MIVKLSNSSNLWKVLLNYANLLGYRRILKIIAPVTFEISSPKGPQLSGSHFFWTVKIREQSIPRNSLIEVNASLKSPKINVTFGEPLLSEFYSILLQCLVLQPDSHYKMVNWYCRKLYVTPQRNMVALEQVTWSTASSWKRWVVHQGVSH